jgi:hypothetical protein
MIRNEKNKVNTRDAPVEEAEVDPSITEMTT